MIRTQCGKYILLRQPNQHFRVLTPAQVQRVIQDGGVVQPEFFRVVVSKEDVSSWAEVTMASHGIRGASTLVTLKNGNTVYAAETVMDIFQQHGLEIADPEPAAVV